MDTYVKLGALSQAALEALLAGAGIAVFFALGLRGLAMWTGDEVDAWHGETPGVSAVEPRTGARAMVAGSRNPAGLVLAVPSFAVVAAIVGTGLYVMLTTK
jgi:hypothetical protein